LQDLGFRLNGKAVLYLQTSVINQKIGKAFPKPRKAAKRWQTLPRTAQKKLNIRIKT
jgi:hypothetical protein